jgi:hypothetical protein
LREEAVAAAAGTVLMAAETPQVTLIDLASELGDARERVTVCDAPCQGTLAVLAFDGGAPAALVWHLSVAKGDLGGEGLRHAAWSAAFGLSWLVGHLHELTVFGSRVNEYRASGREILPDLVRSSVKVRNKRFGLKRFGGWVPHDVLKAAARMLWIERGESEQRLKEIRALIPDQRDAGGITTNIGQIIYHAERMDMSTTTNTFSGTFTGSNLIVSSTLTNVSQNIGQLPNADQATKDELQKLITQLHAELEKVSKAQPARKEQVDAVAASTGELIDKAKQEKPNRTLLQQAIDGVKTIATTPEDVAPPVLSTVTTIAGIIAKLHGF